MATITNTVNTNLSLIATVMDSSDTLKYYIFKDELDDTIMAVKPKEIQDFFYASQEDYDWPDIHKHEGITQLTPNVVLNGSDILIDDAEAKRISSAFYNNLYIAYGTSLMFTRDLNARFDAFYNSKSEKAYSSDKFMNELRAYNKAS